MAIILSDLRDAILLLLEAQETPEIVSEDLIMDGIGAAMRALNQFYPKQSMASLTAGSTVYDLPSDCFDIEAVIDSDTGEIYKRIMLIPGQKLSDLFSGNSWLLSPTGSITFMEATQNDITLYYLANWPVPTPDSQEDLVLEPPEFLKTGLIFYATAYCLVPGAQSSGETGQWKTKIDSGNPEHNPLMKVANWLVKWAEIEWSRQPQYQRAQQR